MIKDNKETQVKSIYSVGIKNIISKINNVSLAMSLISDLLENSNPIKSSIRQIVVNLIDESLLVFKDDCLDKDKQDRVKYLLFSSTSYLNLLYKTDKISKMNWSLISDYIRVLDLELGKNISTEEISFLSKKEKQINVNLTENLTDNSPMSFALRTNNLANLKQNNIQKDSTFTPKNKTKNITDRKDRIINLLKMSGEMSLSNLHESFNGQVASKTIQRDMQSLASESIVEISGTKRWTKYKLKTI